MTSQLQVRIQNQVLGSQFFFKFISIDSSFNQLGPLIKLHINEFLKDHESIIEVLREINFLRWSIGFSNFYSKFC